MCRAGRLNSGKNPGAEHEGVSGRAGGLPPGVGAETCGDLSMLWVVVRRKPVRRTVRHARSVHVQRLAIYRAASEEIARSRDDRRATARVRSIRNPMLYPPELRARRGFWCLRMPTVRRSVRRRPRKHHFLPRGRWRRRGPSFGTHPSTHQPSAPRWSPRSSGAWFRSIRAA